jgi:DNA-binding response OmpR family regulator
MWKILVIEDEEQLCSAIVAYLKSQGVQPTATTTPQEAVHTLEQDKIDLVVVNLKLVSGEAIELLKHIRGSPDLVHLPILAVSAWDMEPTSYDYLEPGDYLVKPFDMRMLSLMIEQLLEPSQTTALVVGREHVGSEMNHEGLKE